VAPHIDFHRGGPGYAWAYRALLEAEDVDCFVVLGTAHAGLDGHSFAATRKPYATPLGPLAVDEEVLEALVSRAPGDLFAAEAAHRREHSIEFQAVSIRYAATCRGGSPGPRFVPLLASFAHECLAAGRDPAEDRQARGTLDALAEVMATVPRRYCLVAGADLAHVGPQFGDPAPVSAEDLRWIARDDRAMLEHVTAGDPAGFLRSVAADGDRRRICGLSPIYALLSLLPPSAGRLLHYGQWPDPHGTVTFASVVFQAPSPDPTPGTAP
jgi:AmmeMemoRadiSam system protein B